MRKHHFTIVELMIAMGLMMIISNILAQVYTRMSQQSIKIVTEKSMDMEGRAALNIIANDFSQARIDNSGASNGGREFKLLSSFATLNLNSRKQLANDFMDSNNYSQSSPTGYTYLAFTALDTSITATDIMNYDSDGFKEIVYWAYPSNDIDDNDGEASSPLKLIRAENRSIEGNYSFFNEGDFNAVVNSDNIILHDLLGINFTFGQVIKPVDTSSYEDRLTSFSNDPDDEFLFDNTDTMPGYVDIMFSLLPNESAVFYLKEDETISIDDSKYTHKVNDLNDTSVGSAIDIDKVGFVDKVGSFSKEGHAWCVAEQTVLHYRNIDGDLYFTKQPGSPSGTVTINGDSEILLGTSFYKRVFLK